MNEKRDVPTYIDFYGLTIVVIVDNRLTALSDFQRVLGTETTHDLDVVRHGVKCVGGSACVSFCGCDEVVRRMEGWEKGEEMEMR